MFRERVQLKTRDELALMRQAGHVVAGMLAEVRSAVAPGVTTSELDSVAEDYLRGHDALSNFKGYHGFPATVCVSVNEEIVHGIPGGRVIEEGDVVSVDGGCSVPGPDGRRWHGDSAFTMVVGDGREEDRHLEEATREALWAAIAALAGADRLGAVGRAVEGVVERWAVRGVPLDIVREYVGHGIGTEMHQPPEVLHHATRDRGLRLKPGMALAIEPMIASGSAANDVLEDGWTVVTRDGSRAAHWEHVVAILPGGVHVLTAPDGGASGLAPHGIVPAALG